MFPEKRETYIFQLTTNNVENLIQFRDKSDIWIHYVMVSGTWTLLLALNIDNDQGI